MSFWPTGVTSPDVRQRASVTAKLRDVAMLASILVAAVAGEVRALAFKDITGKWCGSASSYVLRATR